MTNKTDFTFLSSDGKTRLHGIAWVPEDVTPVAVLQLVHGVAEYIGRYDDFARFLNSHGVIVVGHDHLGHGLSLPEGGTPVYFGDGNTWNTPVDDIYVLHTKLKEQYPHLPLLLMGHSMGSFLSRTYLIRYPGTVDAAICCLDSLNYLTRPADVQRTFQRLHLFIAPGGLLVFDINTVEKLAALDGQVFLDETEDTYCVWRTEYRRGLCTYYVDLFRQQGDGAWDRELEIHRQRAYTVEELTGWLKAAGFTDIRTCGDMVRRSPREGEQRIYFTAIRK